MQPARIGEAGGTANNFLRQGFLAVKFPVVHPSPACRRRRAACSPAQPSLLLQTALSLSIQKLLAMTASKPVWFNNRNQAHQPGRQQQLAMVLHLHWREHYLYTGIGQLVPSKSTTWSVAARNLKSTFD